ncbi:hypothetical protein [Pseudoalteromonas 'SMAR']|uniref:hypothetical protein n=1 Tax=Pseudoalteromonas 'SMAR' TaxID=3416908 RepID=UPI003AF29E96
MAFSININEGFFSAKFAVSDSKNNTQMLAAVCKHDPNGTILDSVNGNIKAAFSILLGIKLYECKQLEKVDPAVNFTDEFTLHYSDIAVLHTSDDKPWDVKVLKFCLLPDFTIEEVA